MKTKQMIIIVVCCMAFVSACMSSQKVKRPESYNYQRGCEAIQKQAWDEAINYLNKDLQENPKNGYSFLSIAYVRAQKREYGQALTAAEQALKYLPKKDKEYVVFAYNTRAEVYVNLGDTAKAIADFTKSVQTDPDDYQAYEKRGWLYFLQREFDLADADFRRILAIDPGAVGAYIGLGGTANAQKHWEEGIKQFDYVTKLDPDYASGFAYRAEAYLGLEKWDEATDDLLKAVEIDEWDDKAVDLITSLKEPVLTTFFTKLKIKAAKVPNEAFWPNLIGLLYAKNERYDDAIRYFEKAIEIDANPNYYLALSYSYAEKGDYRRAIKEIDTALNIDSTDISFMADRARYYYEAGDAKRAIEELDKVIKACPDDAENYYIRGWYKELTHDLDGAVEDLSISLVLDPDYTYSLLSRADAYLKQGKKESAEADYQEIIDKEEKRNDYSCAHYAYHALGQDDKAKEVMEKIIAKDTIQAGSYYDASCLYGRMGNREKSLEYLGKALEKGYRRFAHMALDDDMNPIRETEEYKELIQKYDVVNESALDEGNESADTEEVVSEIPFTKEGSVCTVKCQINGLPLHFIFDTGASTVSLSMVEATFMMKNGYLSKSDVVGSGRFIDANGNVSVGTVINLKKVTFGDSELTNVRASVVSNQKAPLLLGQSVLGRLGKIEIDNQKRVLRLTH